MNPTVTLRTLVLLLPISFKVPSEARGDVCTPIHKQSPYGLNKETPRVVGEACLDSRGTSYHIYTTQEDN